MTMARCIWFLLSVVLAVVTANFDDQKTYHEKEIRELKKPFRMAKINIIWAKALQQLSDPKLRVLLSELKVADKQELTFKKMKAEGGDKEGRMEAQLRKGLTAIMDRYRLGQPSEDSASNKIMDEDVRRPHVLFKDKKLNKLWDKAQYSGFSQMELKALKEEFQHHQDKVDQYYDLLQTTRDQTTNALDDDALNFGNFASQEESDVEVPEAASVNAVREKHRGLKEGFDRLHKLSTTGVESKEFLEPKVAGLWKLAAAADFTPEELESLHTELKHYENRLLKVRHLTGELLRLRKTGGQEGDHPDTDVLLEQKLAEVSPSEGERLLKERVSKQRRTVHKMHEDLELRILQRHSEL